MHEYVTVRYLAIPKQGSTANVPVLTEQFVFPLQLKY